MTKQRLRGPYAVTPDWTDTRRLLDVTEALLRGGIVLLQYRNKRADAALARAQAGALCELARGYAVPCLINDDPQLALALGADGAHIGREDGALAEARAILGPERIIGISCYNEASRAQAAQAGGADYLAFGAMFDSPTKPAAVRAPLELVRQTRAISPEATICCIGGIQLGNARSLVDAGADLLAVITDLFETADPQTQARAYAQLFSPKAPV
ncbi:thiamine phosphate synthase [Niveibacterium sp. SC-1]|uniref:thiamine phosphate synthase n=1 Tax=Niveibacterium sp. SC-1 TaxID=3135646 RepID=UPI00311ECCA1